MIAPGKPVPRAMDAFARLSLRAQPRPSVGGPCRTTERPPRPRHTLLPVAVSDQGPPPVCCFCAEQRASEAAGFHVEAPNKAHASEG